MKTRQISRIHFFSVLLQLSWWCVISTPFLNSQCILERNSVGFDLHLVTVFSAHLWRIDLGLVFT